MTPAEAVADLRRSIAAMRPVDARHKVSIAEFLAALDRLPHPLDEHADATHVTASAVVVGLRGTLLHRHKRLGLWLQPGGHVAPGEAPSDAAIRETVEETGLQPLPWPGAPPLVHVDVHPGGRGHRHLDLRYLLFAGKDDPSPPADESQDVRWFGWDEAIAIADPGLSGALRHLSAGALGTGDAGN
ncbi:MAG: NUDIX domain-containing protein [Nitriliruptorales bacterium]|nr:NUDIX domain-containing protein [Nitriliruptorales bacterium]